MGLKLLMGMPVKNELVLTDTISEAELKQNILDSSYSYEDRKEFQQIALAEKLGEYNVRRYKIEQASYRCALRHL